MLLLRAGLETPNNAAARRKCKVCATVRKYRSLTRSTSDTFAESIEVVKSLGEIRRWPAGCRHEFYYLLFSAVPRSSGTCRKPCYSGSCRGRYPGACWQSTRAGGGRRSGRHRRYAGSRKSGADDAGDRHGCLRDPGRHRYGGTRLERRIRGSICRSEAASFVLQLWREPEKGSSLQ